MKVNFQIKSGRCLHRSVDWIFILCIFAVLAANLKYFEDDSTFYYSRLSDVYDDENGKQKHLWLKFMVQ